MKIRFLGAPGAGIQIDGRTYAVGEVADIPDRWAMPLLGDGRAVAVQAPLAGDRVADVEIEHRDPTPKGRRR